MARLKERNSVTVDWVVNSVVKKIESTQSLGGIDINDLKGEGYLIAVERLPDWNPELSKLSTFLYQVVWGRLMDYVSKYQRLDTPCVELNPTLSSVSGDTNVETRITLDQIAEGLEGKELEVFKRLRLGISHKEIAEEVGVSVRTIGRLINEVKSRFAN